MKSEIILLVVLVGLTIVIPQSFAQNEDGEEKRSISMIQQFSVEEKKERLGEMNEIDIMEQKMRLKIGTDSDVKVSHIIKSGFWVDNDPKIIKILPGAHSELKVTDKDGDYYPHTWDDKTFEDSEYIILQQKLRNYDLIVEYKLENFLDFKNSLWKTDISFPTDVEIFFDEEIDIAYINSRPIDISEADGVNCIGCQMKLEFFNNSDFVLKEIVNEEIKNEIKFWTDGEIIDFEFNNEIREIYFKTEKDNQIITLEIPQNMILFPFEVYLTDEEDDVLDQIDKIRKTEFDHNEEFVKLSIRPTSIGEISIIGATQEKHEKELAKIKEHQKEIEPPIEEKQENEEKMSTKEVFETWGESTENKEQDYTMIVVIIGIIAVVIIGVIIKIKKN